MKTGLIIAAGALTTAVAIYGIWHFGSQYKLLKETCFSFDGYEPLALNKDHIKIEISLKVRNRSEIELDIRGYEFDISINNYKVSKVFSKAPIKIKKQGFTTLKLIVDVNPKSVGNLNFLSGLLLNYQESVVKIKGSLTVKTGGILAKHIPITAESKLRDMIPQPGAPEKTPCI